jgi:hypothetical protein
VLLDLVAAADDNNTGAGADRQSERKHRHIRFDRHLAQSEDEKQEGAF